MNKKAILKDEIKKTIIFEKELAEKIQDYADNLGRDFSKQVRFMIKEYFEMKENK